MFDTLINRIKELSQKQPDKMAAAFKAEQLTYQQLMTKIKAIGAMPQTKFVLKKALETGCYLQRSQSPK